MAENKNVSLKNNIKLPKKSFFFKNQQKYIPYLFIAPNIILFFCFMVLPILYTFYISFNKWDLIGEPKWIGLQNFVSLFSDKIFWTSLWNTLYYSVGTVPVTMAISLLFAILLNQKILFRAFFRSSIYMPVVVSTVVIGMLWTWIFNSEYGILNYVLNLMGFQSIDWLTNGKVAMIPVIITTIWTRTGYNMVIYLAGLQGIPQSYYEASLIDGANKLQQFIYITFPLLKSTNLFVLVMAIIYSFKSFDIIYVMTRGGPGSSTTTIVQYIYKLAFESGKMGKASALGIILFLMMLVFTLLQLKIGEDKQ
jgi:multiple sugar transport system permease protein/alpha-1,4-digalacturonate transport system permease protein